MLTRRSWLGATALAATTPLWSADARTIGHDRLAILTDEAAYSPEDALAFSQQYGLKWVELRDVPGKRYPYYNREPAELKAAAQTFKDAGVKVSFLNTPFLKIAYPGSTVIGKNETPDKVKARIEHDRIAYETRFTELEKAIRCCHIFDVSALRVFGFLRTAEPQALFPQIAECIAGMAEVAHRQGVRIYLENEGSCNVGTSAELARIIQLLPANQVQMNWDPGNAIGLGEKGWPDGYRMLPIDRLGNAQVKGKGLLEEKEFVDWAAILPQLAHDGYQGRIGLETHYFDGTLIEKSHRAMKKLIAMTEA